MFKLVQKQTYTVLSHRYSVLLIFTGIVFVLVSAFQFGEVAMEYGRDQYSALFNIYHDNIAGVAFQNRMCLPIPIDVVYTWVNGSDPKLMADLRKVKLELELKQNHSSSTESPGNKTNSIQCKLQDCLPVKLVVLDTALPSSVGIPELAEAHPTFLQGSRVFNVTKDGGTVISVVEFNKHEEVDVLMRGERVIYLGNKNISISRGYLTSDWTADKSIAMKELLLATGVGKDATEESVRSAIPEEQRQHVSKIELEVIAGMAILTLSNTDVAKGIITEGERTDGDDTIHFMSSYLVWGLEHDVPAIDEDVSASRFEDNEELRYSLRSLEKHAPWIRHVYIVTNGQIPSWLNLDNPRMTIVSHQELFPNKTHLPSFSSPAIESHLHRIPGLSKKFIYLNDDTMFGKEVWPDDFYTHARGQKVYLTWPVPNCAEGCPSSWIKDNYCDKACNTSECDWDGGDCDASRTGQDTSHGGQAGGAAYLEQMYCNSGCANGWVADKYCDQACNVQTCGFDSGDCGTANFHRLYSVKIHGPTQVTLPRGQTVAFFNVSSVFTPNGSISEGRYINSKAVRTATVAQKFFTVHVLLYKNISDTTLTFTIEGKRGDEAVNVTFNVTVNTLPVEETAVSVLSEDTAGLKDKAINKTTDTSEEEFLFEDVAEDIRGPQKPGQVIKDFVREVELPEIEENLLTYDMVAKLKELDEQLTQGDLTEKGHKKQKDKFLKEYRESPEYRTKRDAALKSQLVANTNLQDKTDTMANNANLKDTLVHIANLHDETVVNKNLGIDLKQNAAQPFAGDQNQKPQSDDAFDMSRIMSARKRAEEREKVLHKRKRVPDQKKMGARAGDEQQWRNAEQQRVDGGQQGQFVGQQGQGMGQFAGQQGLNGGQQGQFVGQQMGQGQDMGQWAGQQGLNGGQQGQFMGQQMGQGQDKGQWEGQNMGQGIQNMDWQFPNARQQNVPGFDQQMPGAGQQMPNFGQQLPNKDQQLPNMGQQLPGLKQQQQWQGLEQQQQGLEQQMPNMGQQLPGLEQQQQWQGLEQQQQGLEQQMPNMGQQLPNQQAPLAGQQMPNQQIVGQLPLQNMGQQGVQNGGQVPNVGGQLPNMGRQIPNMAGQVPNLGEVPHFGEQVQNLGGQAPNMGGQLPNMEGQLPNVGGQLPNVGGQLPNIEGQFQNMGKQLPNVGGQAPNMGREAPNMEGQVPLMEHKLGQRGHQQNVMEEVPIARKGNQVKSLKKDMPQEGLVGEQVKAGEEQRAGKLKRRKPGYVKPVPNDGKIENTHNKEEQGKKEQEKEDYDFVKNQQARIKDMQQFYAKKKTDDDNDKKEDDFDDQLLRRKLLSVKENDFYRFNKSDSQFKDVYREHLQIKSRTSDDEIVQIVHRLSTGAENSKSRTNNDAKVDIFSKDSTSNAQVEKFETMRITEGFEGELIKKGIPGVKSELSSMTKMVKETMKTKDGAKDFVFEKEVTEEELRRREEQKEKYSRLTSFLPWERDDGVLYNITQLLSMTAGETNSAYETKSPPRRRLMDAFSDSLRYVNKIYNMKFGFTSRKVPAHMPHMVDVDIMTELQDEFVKEYDLTSSHQVRHSQDMQFAFSYNYYIIGAPKEVNATEVFNEFDTDGSGILSDREIRTLATRLYDLPLDLKTLTNLENIMINCSNYMPKDKNDHSAMVTEKYYEEKMPQVSKSLVAHCDPLVQLMGQSVEGQTKYRHEIMGEDDIAFKMIRTNVSQVIGQLDDIRKNPRKFICLNDNIDHSSTDASMVKAVLQDFYESLFPIVSQFELSRDYRNRFLHIDELREWRRYRDWLRFWTHLSLGGLIIFSIASFCSTQLRALKRRCCPRRRVRSSDIAEKVQHV